MIKMNYAFIIDGPLSEILTPENKKPRHGWVSRLRDRVLWNHIGSKEVYKYTPVINRQFPHAPSSSLTTHTTFPFSVYRTVTQPTIR